MRPASLLETSRSHKAGKEPTVVRRSLGKAAVLTSHGDTRHPNTSNSFFGDNVKLAVSAIIMANLAFSLSDAAIKLISAKFVLWQILVTRSIIAIPLLMAI